MADMMGCPGGVGGVSLLSWAQLNDSEIMER